MGRLVELPSVIFERIRENITKSYECRKEALADIVKVYEKRIWKKAGYSSFEECLEAELKIDRFPLKRTDRRDAVAFLDAAGLTTRAIAAALGTSVGTTARDRATTATVPNGTVRPDRKTGLDGRSQPATRSPKPEKRYPTTRNQSHCLTPKVMSVLATAKDLGKFAQDVGRQLAALGVDDLAHLTMEELEQFADHIYRARHGLKNCQAKIPSATEKTG
ncbi:MAG TPA: hypothetical protein VFI41_05445 [Gemmatimonadales bacterium]|nr:hypothetical protein [Gemmatimonadales bacterium]